MRDPLLWLAGALVRRATFARALLLVLLGLCLLFAGVFFVADGDRDADRAREACDGHAPPCAVDAVAVAVGELWMLVGFVVGGLGLFLWVASGSLVRAALRRRERHRLARERLSRLEALYADGRIDTALYHEVRKPLRRQVQDLADEPVALESARLLTLGAFVALPLALSAAVGVAAALGLSLPGGTFAALVLGALAALVIAALLRARGAAAAAAEHDEALWQLALQTAHENAV